MIIDSIILSDNQLSQLKVIFEKNVFIIVFVIIDYLWWL